jgi:tetratricopeptide (TPR) repeat protein
MARRRAALAGLLVLSSVWIRGQDGRSAREYAEDGMRFWRSGDLARAEASYRHAIQLAPEDRAFLFALGKVLGEEQKFRESDECLEKVLAAEPDNADARRSLAMNQWEMWRPKEARENLERVLRNQPGDQTTRVLLGVLAESQGEYADAVRWLEPVAVEMRQMPGAQIALAHSYYETQRFREAQELVTAQIRSGHANSKSYALLGSCYEAQQAFKQAIDAFRAALERDSSVESNHLHLASAYLESNAAAEALPVASGATERFPESAKVWQLRGHVETRLGFYIDAVQSYTRADALDPKNPGITAALGTAQAAAGMVREAAATFEEGMRRFPRNAALAQGYGLMLLTMAESGDPAVEKRAIGLFKTAISLNPSLAESQYQLGSLFLRKGQTEKAVKYLESALGIEPGNSKAHFALGCAFRREGRESDSAREFDLFEKSKARERDPLTR